MKKSKQKRNPVFKDMISRVELTILSLFLTATIFAQSADRSTKVRSALTTSTSTVSGIIDAAAVLMYTIAVICGFVGAITVYQKWNSGDPNTTKLVSAWFGSALFLALSATFLKAVFVN